MISEHDTIIAIMGLTGTGKSTFINCATNTNDQEVGDSLESCTPALKIVPVLHPRTQKSYILIDTPGIDSSKKTTSDVAILDSLVKLLKDRSKDDRVRVSGVVYLHRMTDVRAEKAPLNAVRKSKSLCHGEMDRRVILATTMWAEVLQDTEEKEEALKEIWPTFAEEPGRLMRFEMTSESAWDIIDNATVADLPGKIKAINAIPTDTIVALMGPTGTGKSTFIHKATGQQSQGIGHSLASHTSEIRAIRHLHPRTGKPYVLVDTPGFDDTNKPDTEILEMIANWLEKTYECKIKLSGIIYLHRISDNRMGKTPLKNLNMFMRLCGTKAVSHVVLTTTMWGRMPEDQGKRRESDLKGNYWKRMLDLGSKCSRFNDTSESAWETIDLAVGGDASDPQVLLLQEELVDLHRRLSETEAGKTLYNILEALLAEHKEAIRKIHEDTKTSRDPKYTITLTAEHERLEKAIEATCNELTKMKVPLKRRFLSHFSLRRTNARVLEL